MIRVAKTKVLISFAVTAKLFCAFVFAQAICLFSYAVAYKIKKKNNNNVHIFKAIFISTISLSLKNIVYNVPFHNILLSILDICFFVFF